MANKVSKFLAHLTEKCIDNNISLKFISQNSVDMDSFECSGYFDEKEIAVATKKKDWVDVLVHESCHLDQFLEKSPFWFDDEIGMHVVEKWIQKKHNNAKKAHQCFLNVIKMELDCEKRTIKKLKKYDLKVNKNNYIQQANSYLFSYVYSFKNKKWYPKPYEKNKIVKKMPIVFLAPEKYFSYYKKYEELYK